MFLTFIYPSSGNGSFSISNVVDLRIVRRFGNERKTANFHFSNCFRLSLRSFSVRLRRNKMKHVERWQSMQKDVERTSRRRNWHMICPKSNPITSRRRIRTRLTSGSQKISKRLQEEDFKEKTFEKQMDAADHCDGRFRRPRTSGRTETEIRLWKLGVERREKFANVQSHIRRKHDSKPKMARSKTSP